MTHTTKLLQFSFGLTAHDAARLRAIIPGPAPGRLLPGDHHRVEEVERRFLERIGEPLAPVWEQRRPRRGSPGGQTYRGPRQSQNPPARAFIGETAFQDQPGSTKSGGVDSTDHPQGDGRDGA